MTGDRNIEFLSHSKALLTQNRIDELIIPDKQISSSCLLSQEEILVSQYASSLQDDIINPLHYNSACHYSLPVTFALITKAIKVGNLQLVAQITSSSLKQTPKSIRNRHILLYNKVKISLMQSDIKASTFYCENLLKQSGDGSDYYTYQFLRLLINQGRAKQALGIAQRHLQAPSSQAKHKVQSIYIYLLGHEQAKIEGKVEKLIEEYFSNRKICIRNCFNIALLLKRKHPERSADIFKSILAGMSTGILVKFQVMIKINLLQIYQDFYLPRYPQSISRSRLKQVLEECQAIYNELETCIAFDQAMTLKRKNSAHLLNKVVCEMKNESNLTFFQSIKSEPRDVEKSLLDANLEELSEANPNTESPKKSQKYYQQKRAEHEKRLKFLMKKEKQLKAFFQKLQVQRNGSKLNIKLLDKTLMESSCTATLDNPQLQELKACQLKYEERKKKLSPLYEDNEINAMIANFINQWVTPHQRQMFNSQKAEKLKKFVITLDCSNEEQKTPYESSTNRSGQKQKCGGVSHQAFRVKNGISRKSSEKMLEGLKCNDYISNKIIHNLRNNIVTKKKEEEKESLNNRSFSQLLQEGEVLEQQNKLEEVHEHYVQMYKKFKERGEKEILLLKIGDNFQRLCMFPEAEKTYTKCAKYNSTEAFFRLGSLQIRNGKVEVGIENLEKANCIDRHNLKIEIELVYAYSLMESTTERALALASTILKTNPDCMEALIMSSKILQKKGKLKEALEIGLAISNSVKTASTYHYVGLLYLNDSNVSEAFRYFQKAVECEPHHHPSLIELATIISEAKPNEAIEILKGVLSIDPCNQLAFARLGKIYETYQNDFQNALLIYKKGLEYSPSYENYVKIGDCHFKLGSVVDAYLNYKEALAIKRTPQIYEKIAEVHEFQHQDKKAAEVYAAALAELPKDGTSWSYAKQKKYLSKLGKLLLMNQEYEAAYGYLSEVVCIEESFETLKLLGQACFGKGDYNESLNYYEQAAAMCPEDNIELLENIAVCFDKKEEFLTSKEIYEKILSLDPKNIKCLNNLANILLILGKTNEAFYWFEFMLQQAPNNIEKRMRVADIYATIGDWSKVEQHLTICYKQKQNDIRVIEKMVNLYKEKRDTKQLNKFEKRLGLLKSNTTKIT